jgi:hypothetical protein
MGRPKAVLVLSAEQRAQLESTASSPSSEKFRGQPAFNQKENSKAGCPLIASYCTTWFTTGDALFAEKVSPKY